MRVNTFKLLGVYISHDLTWSVYVDYVVAKANRRLYALRKLKKCGIAPSDIVTVYCSIVRSVLEYAPCVLGSLRTYPKKTIKDNLPGYVI